MFKKLRLSQLDTLGAALSAACAVHCAAQPLLLAFLPFLGLGFLLDERLESAFLLFSLCLASYTLWRASRQHHQKWAWPLLGLGALLIAASRLAGFEGLEMPLAVSGASAVALAHGVNLVLQQRRLHQHSEHCAHTPTPAETRPLGQAVQA